jgi:hypothetical protein
MENSGFLCKAGGGDEFGAAVAFAEVVFVHLHHSCWQDAFLYSSRRALKILEHKAHLVMASRLFRLQAP